LSLWFRRKPSWPRSGPRVSWVMPIGYTQALVSINNAISEGLFGWVVGIIETSCVECWFGNCSRRSVHSIYKLFGLLGSLVRVQCGGAVVFAACLVNLVRSFIYCYLRVHLQLESCICRQRQRPLLRRSMRRGLAIIECNCFYNFNSLFFLTTSRRWHSIICEFAVRINCERILKSARGEERKENSLKNRLNSAHRAHPSPITNKRW